jgi:arginine exporter protein ArgO
LVSELLRAAGLGFGLGVVTGMPLAVINVAIVEAATAGRRRFAIGLGLGGGIADTVLAMLAFTGVGRLVTAEPALVRGLAIAAALAIVAYAVTAWRRRTRAVDQAQVAQAAGSRDGGDVHLTRGLATALALALPNPAALVAWLAVAAASWPDATPLEAAVIAGAVGAGSALWFTMLARWISRVRRDHPVLEVIPRLALILFLAFAVGGVVRAL